MLVKRAFFLLNEAFAMAILDLSSHVHLPSFVNMLPKYLKHSTFSSCFWSIILVTGDGCLEILITFTHRKYAVLNEIFLLHLREVFQEGIHGVKRDLPILPLISQNLAKLKYAKTTKRAYRSKNLISVL